MDEEGDRRGVGPVGSLKNQAAIPRTTMWGRRRWPQLGCLFRRGKEPEDIEKGSGRSFIGVLGLVLVVWVSHVEKVDEEGKDEGASG